jgi:hypothetical protein
VLRYFASIPSRIRQLYLEVADGTAKYSLATVICIIYILYLLRGFDIFVSFFSFFVEYVLVALERVKTRDMRVCVAYEVVSTVHTQIDVDDISVNIKDFDPSTNRFK